MTDKLNMDEIILVDAISGFMTYKGNTVEVPKHIETPAQFYQWLHEETSNDRQKDS